MNKMERDLTLALRLRQRITIQTPTDVTDSAGGVSRSWAMHARVWAEVLPKSGREMVVEGGVKARAETKFTLRYRSDITSEMRIAYDGAHYEIRSVTDLYGRGIALEIIGEKR